MHGLGLNNYMVHEFITPLIYLQKIGPDIMGVWSDWLLKYYQKYSSIYERIEVSGPLRKPSHPNLHSVEAMTSSI